jgi:hypothetical protein
VILQHAEMHWSAIGNQYDIWPLFLVVHPGSWNDVFTLHFSHHLLLSRRNFPSTQ